MQAVILAAGKGLRLRPFTEHSPKPLIPIADKPLLEYTLSSLPDSVSEIIIVVGYFGSQIRNHFGEQWQGKTITYVEQENLVGTGDALMQAKPFLKGHFLAVNGDDLYNKEDLERLCQTESGILAWESSVNYEFGLQISNDKLLIGFDPNSNLLNCGAYFLQQKFFETPLATVTVHDKIEYSLPHTLVAYAKSNRVEVVTATHWLPVGTPQQLEFANNYYLNKHHLKA